MTAPAYEHGSYLLERKALMARNESCRSCYLMGSASLLPQPPSGGPRARPADRLTRGWMRKYAAPFDPL